MKSSLDLLLLCMSVKVSSSCNDTYHGILDFRIDCDNETDLERTLKFIGVVMLVCLKVCFRTVTLLRDSFGI